MFQVRANCCKNNTTFCQLWSKVWLLPLQRCGYLSNKIVWYYPNWAAFIFLFISVPCYDGVRWKFVFIHENCKTINTCVPVCVFRVQLLTTFFEMHLVSSAGRSMTVMKCVIFLKERKSLCFKQMHSNLNRKVWMRIKTNQTFAMNQHNRVRLWKRNFLSLVGF